MIGSFLKNFLWGMAMMFIIGLTIAKGVFGLFAISAVVLVAIKLAIMNKDRRP
jgi:hypothetical protein